MRKKIVLKYNNKVAVSFSNGLGLNSNETNIFLGGVKVQCNMDTDTTSKV